MLKTADRMTVSGEDQSIKQLLLRYALRYYISGPARDALVDQTLAAMAHDTDLVLENPIEKAVALTMHQIFRSNIAQDARLKSRHTSSVSKAESRTC